MPDFVPIGDLTNKPPYSFEDAPSLRHKAWAAGFDPAYWYPAEWEHDVKPGQVVEVKFLDQSVALFRGKDGTLGALENRCAHRQIKLSLGEVKDCQLACAYHGWTYNCEGRLTHVEHELFGGSLPNVRLRSYPVQEKYGIIWIFFGDPALVSERPQPYVPEVEGPNPWIKVPLDYTIRCHPTAIVNNIMDSTHVASLHRTFRTRSFLYGNVTGVREEEETDRVTVTHEIALDPTALLRWIVLPPKYPSQDAVYEYPYLHVLVGGVYKLYNFMRPIGLRKTRLFMFGCADRLKIPGTPWPVPDAVTRPFIGFGRDFLAKPLFTEDVWSFEAEQQGYDQHHNKRAIDPHPAIHPSYKLTVRKWEEHLARERTAARQPDLQIVGSHS